MSKNKGKRRLEQVNATLKLLTVCKSKDYDIDTTKCFGTLVVPVTNRTNNDELYSQLMEYYKTSIRLPHTIRYGDFNVLLLSIIDVYDKRYAVPFTDIVPNGKTYFAHYGLYSK